MIFPNIECEETIQTNDKMRISGSKSYVSKDETAITLVRIKPEASGSFITVTGSPIISKNWFLDWEYSTDGAKVITLEVTTNGLPVTTTKTITVLTSTADKLFSNDQDLASVENNVLKYVPDGKNTFNYLHRRAQSEMIGYLNKNGWKRYDGTDITKADFLDIEQVRYWSTYATLRLLFKDLSNIPGDIFEIKSKQYQNEEHSWREIAVLKLDLNGDTVQGNLEGIGLTTRDLIRR